MMRDRAKAKQLSFLKLVGLILGIIWSTVALVRLWDEFTSGGATGILLLLIREYEAISGPFFGLFRPLLELVTELLARLTGWPISLHPLWKDIFALLALYFGAQISDFRRYGRPYVTLASHAVWALFCTLGTVAASGLRITEEWSPGITVVGVSLVGIVIHRIGFAVLWAINRSKYFEESFYRSFAKKALGAAAIGIGGLLICVALRGLTPIDFLGREVSPSFVVLISLLLLLASFHIAPSSVELLRARRVADTEGTFQIGTKILGTVALTICAIIGLS